jgi:hypothetical protein
LPAKSRIYPRPRSKSLFASFSSEKEDSSFLKKKSKRLLCLRGFDNTGFGRSEALHHEV